MKILFVCQQYIHSARWISQLKDSHHEIYVFDCLDRPVHKELSWTNFIGDWSKRKFPYIKGEDRLKKAKPNLYRRIEGVLKVTPAEKLCEVIEEIKPDLVHSLEMQSQTYHILKANKRFDFKWAYFCWGNDLFAYQNQPSHKKRITDVMNQLDFFFADTHRDIELAKKFGYKKKFSVVFPGGGGYEIKSYKPYIKPVEERKSVIIKGYQHNYGRALHILNALELIIDKIKDQNIYVYSAHQVVVDKIEELKIKHDLKIEYSTRNQELSHKDLLQKFGEAQIAIGNNSSDGIPNTLLEAMICGAFPIQSNPGGATEDYIEDGVNGLLIQNPENAQEVADKITEALNNVQLREKAFEINQQKAKELDYKVIQEKVLETYSKIEKSL